MRNSTVTAATALALVCVALGVIQVPVSAQAAYKAPRTADGTPDLQGIWQVRNTSAAFGLDDSSLWLLVCWAAS